MIKIKYLAATVSVLAFLEVAVKPVAGAISVCAADTFYNGVAGATGVREMPLFVAKDVKIFDKYDRR
ncbi:MAG: hypothetical protein WCH75_27465 [Candidatus Binatia bacterium]